MLVFTVNGKMFQKKTRESQAKIIAEMVKAKGGVIVPYPLCNVKLK